MASIRELSDLTGFSRDALTARAKRFGLDMDNLNPKSLLMLKPLDEQHARGLSLEQQRTAESFENTRLKKLQADEKDRQLANVDQLIEAENDLHEGIAAIVKSSELSDDNKEDVLSLIRDHCKRWAEGFGS
tara:strand:- start:1947 stop:2339 length:393 start_codon:yes stop_codon:yes gene_type:complete